MKTPTHTALAELLFAAGDYVLAGDMIQARLMLKTAEPLLAQFQSRSVRLESYGARKIEVIKALRNAISGLPLRGAKELAASAPAIVASDLEMGNAQALVEDLRRAGATASLEQA